MAVSLNAQPLNSIYENNSLVSFEKQLYNLDYSFHTSIRPYFITDLKKKFNYDSTLNSQNIEKFYKYKTLNAIFNRSLIVISNKDFRFTIDPLFDFGIGYDIRNNRSSWINTRGFLIEGYLGKDFAYATSFYENQAKVPLWINSYVINRGIMPGQGRVKPFGTGAFDYANVSGYVSWSPGKFLNLQFGHGKQFWGDGYRSLILSDFSMYHPYLMITTTFWKIKYVNLFSQFSHPDIIEHLSKGGDPIYAKKFSTMHYLSFAPGKRWNISLFEAIIWQASDSSYYRGFELSYLNPIIFYRPVEFNLGSGDNALVGMNLRFTAAKGIAFYGQVVFDEFKFNEIKAGNGWSGNKYALQAGVKTFNLFGIENLNLQAEYNSIRPYTYSHYTAVQNYSNAKEPLAHPSGANTKEAVIIAKYNYKRLFLNLKYVWSGFGLDSAGLNFGKNIFLSPNDVPRSYGNYTGQGLYTKLNQLDASISFLINPSTNMNVYIAATFRSEQNFKMNIRYNYLSFGFRTSLRNLYNDFY
jgi:hypothetical protein